MRTCNKCGVEQELTEFYVHPLCKDGRRPDCRTCFRKRADAWTEKNRAHKNAVDRAWHAANKDAASVTRRAWYEKNKLTVLARVAVWAEANRHLTRGYTQKYRRAHLVEHAVRMQRRNALRRSLPATLTPEEWLQILEVFDHRCAYCLKPITSTPNMEHVIAVVRGGGFTADNIVPACKACNTKKLSAPVFAMLLKRPNSILRIQRGGC